MTDIIGSWFDVLTALFTIVTVLFECYAIVLVLKITPKAMHTFRYFLCSCTVLDLILSLAIGIGVAPRFMLPECFIVETRGLFALLGQNGGRIGLSFGIFVVGQIIFFESYALIYRFATIQSKFPRIPKLLTDLRLLLFLFLLGSGVLIACVILSQQYLTVPEIPLVATNSCQVTNFPWYRPGVTVLIALNMDLIKQNATALLVMVCVAMIGVLLSGLIASAFFIVHLRMNVEMMSRQTYIIHIRLIVLVVIQMTVATMFIMYPVAVAALYVCLRPNEYPPKEFAEVGLTFEILYGLLNVLLTITFITPYRKFTMALVHGKWQEVRKLWRNEGSNDQQRTKNVTVVALISRGKVRARSMN